MALFNQPALLEGIHHYYENEPCMETILQIIDVVKGISVVFHKLLVSDQLDFSIPFGIVSAD
jgi:hypothetical protein